MEAENDKIILRKAKNKIYITIAVLGLTVLFSILFVAVPYLGKIEKNSGDLATEKQRLVFLEDQVAKIEEFKNNYQLYKPSLEKFDQLYIDPKNPADFFKFLEKEAYEHKIKLKVSLLPDSSIEDNKFVNFQISVQGDFLDVLKFSEKLEASPYLIKIQNISVKKSGQDFISKKTVSGTVDADFSIEALIKQ